MELIYTWKQLKAVQDRIAEIKEQTDIITGERTALKSCDHRRQEYNALWDECHKLEALQESMSRQVIPEVGMPCTVHYYSDSSGAYVKKVISPKHILVKEDGIYHGEKEYTLRSNGDWVQKGSPTRDWATLCHLGYKSDYFDMSF